MSEFRKIYADKLEKLCRENAVPNLEGIRYLDSVKIEALIETLPTFISGEIQKEMRNGKNDGNNSDKKRQGRGGKGRCEQSGAV